MVSVLLGREFNYKAMCETTLYRSAYSLAVSQGRHLKSVLQDYYRYLHLISRYMALESEDGGIFSFKLSMSLQIYLRLVAFQVRFRLFHNEEEWSCRCY
jgi:hypothetical protein